MLLSLPQRPREIEGIYYYYGHGIFSYVEKAIDGN